MPGIAQRVLLGLALSSVLVAATPAAAKPAPAVLTALAAAPSAVAPGGAVTARAVVAARRGARHVRLRYTLARHPLASLALGTLRSAKKLQRRTVLTIPTTVTPGRYRLVGCVGSSCRGVPLVVAAPTIPDGPADQT